ncbi:MAG TPA: hypothetical protein VGP99_07585 [Tepidisphaeraceae bacterium]|jgi:hypothetical protein|nr:hypothetical protein [Tepidisphaeraceae bacterium]
MRFMLLGLVVLVWLASPNQARASCGYYVVIGHPSSETAGEQARMRHEQLPLEQKKSPCNGPQCRGQDRPTTPAQAIPVSLQDPMALAVRAGDADQIDTKFVLVDDCSFLSEPHVWRIDPPPRF